MARITWLTDIHLNFVPPPELDRFCEAVRAERPDLVVISGDIAEAKDVAWYLRLLTERLACPIAFVLGNHDFYGGSIPAVRRHMTELCRDVPGLTYLGDSGPIELSPTAALVGHDGWADARCGDYEHSDVMLNDYYLIQELAQAGVLGEDRPRLRRELERLAGEAADHIRRVLPEALAQHEHVLLLTHVPPFREACWYEGRLSDDNWVPHFASRAMGDLLREIMLDHPHRRLTVLCGHTHGAGQARILDNLLVLTGGAVYGHPDVQRTFDL